MNPVELAAIVAVVVQFVKTKLLASVWDKLGQWLQFGIAILVCVGVVVFKAIQTGAQFNLALLWILIEVIVAVTGGYKLATAFLPGLSQPASK